MPTLASHAAPRLPETGLLSRRWAERRVVVLGAAALLFAAVLILMRVAGDRAPGMSLIAVVPITLVALELGVRGGIATALAAVLVVAVSAAGGHPELEPAAVAARGLAFLAVGAVAGRFSDQLSAAQRRQAALLRSGLRLTDVGDAESLPALIAEAALATPRVIGVTVTLDDARPARAGQVSHVRTQIPVVTDGRTVGTIGLAHDGELAAADLGALQLLAVQAGLAAGNMRRLQAERERAAVEGRLRQLGDDLIRSRAGIGRILEEQESERRRIAVQLHEELAQVLAAALIAVGALRRTSSGADAATLDLLQGHVTEVLQDLRRLAGSIRPPLLEQLGLVAALQSLAASVGEEQGRLVRVDAPAAPTRLRPEVQTSIFRVVEQALEGTRETVAGDVRVALGPAGDATELVLSLPGALPERTVEDMRVRTDSLGGSLTVERGAARAIVHVRIP
jgi:signal transduction histidine kinase